MRVTRLLVSSTLLLMWAGAPATAAVCNGSGAPLRRHFQFTFGYSPASPTLIGTAAGRRLLAAGFEFAYQCWEWKPVAISYTAAVFPATVVLQPAHLAASLGVVREVPQHAVYGFGILPLGFAFEFGRKRRLFPFGEIAGGIVASTEPIPVNGDRSSGLNFMFYLGGGLRANIRSRSSVSVGYRFQHISNAGTTSFNPGLDNNVIYVGYGFRR